MSVVILVIAVIVAGIAAYIAFKSRQRAQAREYSRTKLGKPCPSCGKYVHPAAGMCKYCYAEIPPAKAGSDLPSANTGSESA